MRRSTLSTVPRLVAQSTAANNAREPEFDVGPPAAPDVHVTPHPSVLTKPSAERLPVITLALLAIVGIGSVFLAAVYAP